METREKQNLLTMIIIVAFLAIALIVGFIIYPEIKENNKNNIQNSHSITKTESTNTISTKTSSITQNITNANTETTETTKTDSTNGYIGREEMDNEKTESIAQTKEERAIDLARKEWGENDKNVTYNVEQKEENIYYVAVRLNDQVQKWYEIDTEKWTIKEY